MEAVIGDSLRRISPVVGSIIGTADEIAFIKRFAEVEFHYQYTVDPGRNLVFQIDSCINAIRAQLLYTNERIVVLCPWSKAEFTRLNGNFSKIIDSGRVCLVCPQTSGTPGDLEGVLAVPNFLFKRHDHISKKKFTYLTGMGRVAKLACDMWKRYNFPSNALIQLILDDIDGLP